MPDIYDASAGWNQGLQGLGQILFPDPSKVAQAGLLGAQQRGEQLKNIRLQDENNFRFNVLPNKIYPWGTGPEPQYTRPGPQVPGVPVPVGPWSPGGPQGAQIAAVGGPITPGQPGQGGATGQIISRAMEQPGQQPPPGPATTPPGQPQGQPPGQQPPPGTAGSPTNSVGAVIAQAASQTPGQPGNVANAAQVIAPGGSINQKGTFMTGTAPDKDSPAPGAGAPPAPNQGTDGSPLQNNSGDGPLHPNSVNQPNPGSGRMNLYSGPASSNGSPAPALDLSGLIYASIRSGFDVQQTTALAEGYLDEAYQHGMIDQNTYSQMLASLGSNNMLQAQTTMQQQGVASGAELAAATMGKTVEVYKQNPDGSTNYTQSELVRPNDAIGREPVGPGGIYGKGGAGGASAEVSDFQRNVLIDRYIQGVYAPQESTTWSNYPRKEAAGLSTQDQAQVKMMADDIFKRSPNLMANGDYTSAVAQAVNQLISQKRLQTPDQVQQKRTRTLGGDYYITEDPNVFNKVDDQGNMQRRFRVPFIDPNTGQPVGAAATAAAGAPQLQTTSGQPVQYGAPQLQTTSGQSVPNEGDLVPQGAGRPPLVVHNGKPVPMNAQELIRWNLFQARSKPYSSPLGPPQL